MKRFARYFGVLTVLGAAGLPLKLQAAEPEAPEAAVIREIIPAELEKRATRLVAPEALKVLSRHFYAAMPINSFRATVLREYVESAPAGQPKPSPAGDWTRAELHLGFFGAKVTRYWPGHSESIAADGHALYITDSRFPLQYRVEAVPTEEWGNAKWRERLMTRSGLDWGALGVLGANRDGFAAILLHRGLVSVTLAAPRELDGTPCDVVEIRLVNNYGGTSIDRLAIARSDGFARMLEVEDEIPTKGTSVLRETYLHVHSYNPLAEAGMGDESPLFRFVPAKGAKKVAAFAKAN